MWVSVNYRLAPKWKWPACYEDVVGAVKWTREHAAEYHGDAKRMVVVGYSAGGQIVFLGAVKGDLERAAEGGVKGFVGLAPPTDLELDLPARGGLSPSLQGLLGKPHELTEESRGIARFVGGGFVAAGEGRGLERPCGFRHF